MNFTPKASSKIVDIAEENGFEAPIIRVKVQGGGCAGFMYDMNFLDDDEKQKIDELDECWEMDGFDVIIDPISLQYLEEVTIDYIVTEQSEGFKFLNPAVKGSCGCGSSVAF